MTNTKKCSPSIYFFQHGTVVSVNYFCNKILLLLNTYLCQESLDWQRINTRLLYIFQILTSKIAVYRHYKLSAHNVYNPPLDLCQRAVILPWDWTNFCQTKKHKPSIIPFYKRFGQGKIVLSSTVITGEAWIVGKLNTRSFRENFPLPGPEALSGALFWHASQEKGHKITR